MQNTSLFLLDPLMRLFLLLVPSSQSRVRAPGAGANAQFRWRN